MRRSGKERRSRKGARRVEMLRVFLVVVGLEWSAAQGFFRVVFFLADVFERQLEGVWV